MYVHLVRVDKGKEGKGRKRRSVGKQNKKRACCFYLHFFKDSCWLTNIKNGVKDRRGRGGQDGSKYCMCVCFLTSQVCFVKTLTTLQFVVLNCAPSTLRPPPRRPLFPMAVSAYEVNMMDIPDYKQLCERKRGREIWMARLFLTGDWFLRWHCPGARHASRSRPNILQYTLVFVSLYWHAGFALAGEYIHASPQTNQTMVWNQRIWRVWRTANPTVKYYGVLEREFGGGFSLIHVIVNL